MLAAGCGGGRPVRDVFARQGRLDLSAANSLERPCVLQGGWAFYWKRLLQPGSGTNRAPAVAPDDYLSVPGMWNAVSHKPLPAYGFATLRLVVRLPRSGERLGLILPTVASSYRLWLNGEPVAAAGQVGTNRSATQPADRPQAYYFTARQQTLELLLHMANFHYKDGGVIKAPELGTENAIRQRHGIARAREIFIIGALIIMAFYHGVLFLLRREDRSTLVFSLICLSLALRTALMGEFALLMAWPGFNWFLEMRLVFFTSYLMIPLFSEFFFRLFPDLMGRRLVNFFHALSLPFLLSSLVLPVEIFSPGLPWYQVLSAIVITYLVVVMVRALVRKREGALLVVLGMSAFLVTGVHDMLVTNNVLQGTLLIPFGFLVMLFSQAAVLSLRAARAFRTAERLSRKLEQEVAERTKELEQERLRLQLRNDLMEKELILARNIQLQYIPARTPSSNVAFFYKPMEQVGGDFFDFISLPGGNLGVFLSDVSGHGLPAAFITSTIKAYLTHSALEAGSPSQLLLSLNQYLFDQTAGQFITAFYGILQPGSGRMEFANAGHVLPYLLTSEGCEPFPRNNRGVPLAVLNNHELRDLAREYANAGVSMAPGDKLFLCTDGLVETVHYDHNWQSMRGSIPDFGKCAMLSALRDLRELPPKHFLESLYQRLVEFRGNESFEDDVCMICIGI